MKIDLFDMVNNYAVVIKEKCLINPNANLYADKTNVYYFSTYVNALAFIESIVNCFSYENKHIVIK